jgi:hypothetical protein
MGVVRLAIGSVELDARPLGTRCTPNADSARLSCKFSAIVLRATCRRLEAPSITLMKDHGARAYDCCSMWRDRSANWSIGRITCAVYCVGSVCGRCRERSR